MYFADTSTGKSYSKDPSVVKFNGKYYMYYSVPPYWDGRDNDVWTIGAAESDDMENWTVVNRLFPEQQKKNVGICAPGAIVLNGVVHMFYQEYGYSPKDKICHAVSLNGIDFKHDPTNPIFAPGGDWNNGRAIDADVIAFGDKLIMYYATRDPKGEIQKIGVCSAPLNSDFGSSCWTGECSDSILQPELPWENKCIEAPAVCSHGGRIYMFYGGAYNNEPQQIGCAVSDDGINFTRLSDKPFLPNGGPGSWNSSESGHPFAFEDDDGRYYLFYQGNNDHGKTWYLSRLEFEFGDGIPHILTVSC